MKGCCYQRGNLFVLQMNDYSKPMTDTERMMESSMRRINKESGTDAVLNTFRTKYLSPESVTLRDIKQVSAPAGKASPIENSAADVTQKKPLQRLSSDQTLYLCKATATISLPESARGKIDELNPVVATSLHYEDNVIELPVVYNTALNEDNQLIIGVGFTNPMTGIILSVLLRQDVPDSDAADTSADE